MGNSSSMLTQYDIEEVQEHCNYLFTQGDIVALYKRFRQLDRNAKGFISADEFLSIPEFSVDPLSQRLVRMVDGLNFKDFVAFLSAFSASAPLQQKIEREILPRHSSFHIFIVSTYSQKIDLGYMVFDFDDKGKVTFDDILQVLRDLTGSFISEKQREQVLSHVFEEAGYERDCCFLVADFVKILGNPGLKMEVEVPVD